MCPARTYGDIINGHFHEFLKPCNIVFGVFRKFFVGFYLGEVSFPAWKILVNRRALGKILGKFGRIVDIFSSECVACADPDWIKSCKYVQFGK